MEEVTPYCAPFSGSQAEDQPEVAGPGGVSTCDRLLCSPADNPARIWLSCPAWCILSAHGSAGQRMHLWGEDAGALFSLCGSQRDHLQVARTVERHWYQQTGEPSEDALRHPI